MSTFIEDLSVLVYKRRLEDDDMGAVRRMLAMDEDKSPGCGERLLRHRARAYEPVVRAAFACLNIKEPELLSWDELQEVFQEKRRATSAERKQSCK